jgi:hypothetical protein
MNAKQLVWIACIYGCWIDFRQNMSAWRKKKKRKKKGCSKNAAEGGTDRPVLDVPQDFLS